MQENESGGPFAKRHTQRRQQRTMIFGRARKSALDALRGALRVSFRSVSMCRAVSCARLILTIGWACLLLAHERHRNGKATKSLKRRARRTKKNLPPLSEGERGRAFKLTN